MSKCDHKYSRSFLGPMPERVLDRLKENYRKHDNLVNGTDEDNSNPASQLVMMHAFSFFIHEGGRTEDWNEQVQKQTRKKMMHRWRESGWGKVLDTGDERETPDEWIGHNFEIGKFLGLDIINPSSHQVVNGAVSGTQDQVSLSDTAPPEAGPSSGRVNDLRKLALPLRTASADASVRVTQHALEQALEHVNPTTPSDTREQGSDANISVGTVPLSDPTTPEDDVLRDRMLVRACYSETSLASLQFDEEYHRTARDIEYKAWGEYLVVLRKDRVELYEDHTFPVREWLSQHKRLAFVIPLSITRTQLSLYSFVDLTFCLTYTPKVPRDDHVASFRIPFVSRGSKVFIFKVKSRSRAYDWVWKLWLQFNGKLPRSMDVKCPGLNATVTIDAPETCGNEVEKMYEIFNRENLIRLCVEGLSALSDWSSLIQREIANGKRLELAWRWDANLDWIWLETDVNQEKRKWAVLCGLVAKESLRSVFLEIRLAEHYPNHIHVRNGDRIDEPLGMEGYLQQLRPYSLSKHRVYLSTHDGNLFVLSPQNAYPPSPPGLPPHDPSPNLPDGKSARQTEVWRGALQIMNATGVCDLRNIVAVRRAFQLLSPQTHNEREAGDDSLNTWGFEEPGAEDNQDDGGGQPSGDLYTRRSFELLLKNGHVVRFEAYSSKLALDWINRLRPLVSYWKARHRFDAQQEMELAQATRPPLTVPRREEGTHAPLKLPTPLPALVTMYTTSNWCMLEGCRPVVRSGKLFTRKGLYGQYRLVHMFLVANHLVQYRIRTNSLLHPIVKKICLSDAYVSSGYLAALVLPGSEFDPSKLPVGRRFQDGLETDDKDEDVIFMICYRPRSRHTPDTLYHTNTTNVPPLSSKQKTLVFRTRSKLERDSWCWAINCEIERTVRMQKGRENAIRNNGDVIPSRTA